MPLSVSVTAIVAAPLSQRSKAKPATKPIFAYTAAPAGVASSTAMRPPSRNEATQASTSWLAMPR